MWIEMLTVHEEFSVRATLSSDGVWYFFGTDVARMLDYSGTSHFNRRFCDLKVKDIVHRGIHHHLKRRDLNTSVIDIDTLERTFVGFPCVRDLRKTFFPARGETRVLEVIGSGPSIRRCRPVVAAAFSEKDEFPDLVCMAEFLDNFKREVMEFYEIKSSGLMFHSGILESDEAPTQLKVSFRDGFVERYQLVKR